MGIELGCGEACERRDDWSVEDRESMVNYMYMTIGTFCVWLAVRTVRRRQEKPNSVIIGY